MGKKKYSIRDISRAINDDRCVILPCKLGATIFILPNYIAFWNPIEETTITGVAQFHSANGSVSTELTTSLGICVLWERDFGKKVFYTRKEAEIALKKSEVA